MNSLAGTLTLVRLAVRRDRLILPACIAAFTFMVTVSTSATVALYPTVESRIQAAAGINNMASLAALYGRIYAAIERVVSDGQRNGEFVTHAPPAEQASIIVAVNDGMLLEWLRRGRGGQLDGETLVRAMRLTVLDGVREHGAKVDGAKPNERGSNNG